jgi:hypothetical protein
MACQKVAEMAGTRYNSGKPQKCRKEQRESERDFHFHPLPCALCVRMHFFALPLNSIRIHQQQLFASPEITAASKSSESGNSHAKQSEQNSRPSLFLQLTETNTSLSDRRTYFSLVCFPLLLILVQASPPAARPPSSSSCPCPSAYDDDDSYKSSFSLIRFICFVSSASV